jgi:C4-dicarboxylate transporter DctM subunit
MDIISATLILTPIFLPIVVRFGVDPLHFGLLMTLNLGIGYATPPMGVNLYVISAVIKRDILSITRSVLPFLIIQIIVLIIITYVPELVMWLPRIMGYVE